MKAAKKVSGSKHWGCYAKLECGGDDMCDVLEEFLGRRIHPNHVLSSETDGEVIYRPSTAAFDNSSDGTPMSAGRLSLADAKRQLRGRRKHSLVRIKVGFLMELHEPQAICPIGDERDPSHTYVCGPKTKSVRAAIAKEAEWLVLRPRY